MRYRILLLLLMRVAASRLADRLVAAAASSRALQVRLSKPLPLSSLASSGAWIRPQPPPRTMGSTGSPSSSSAAAGRRPAWGRPPRTAAAVRRAAAALSPRFRGGDNKPRAIPAHPMPRSDGSAVARDVFSHLHFYDGDEKWRDLYAERRDRLGPNLTVDELKRQCYERGECVEDVLSEAYGVPLTHEYFSSGDVKALKLRRYVPLNGHRDLHNFLARSGREPYGSRPARRENRPPAYGQMYHWCDTREPHCYMSPCCYVLGPSGCGKTFFALEFLPDFLNRDGKGGLDRDTRALPNVALYLHPAEIKGLKWGNTKGKSGSDIFDEREERLVDWIRQKLEEELGRKLKYRLPMHVCLVLDNAGDGRLRGFFEARNAAHAVRAAAERKIAERVVVVVAGTGINVESIQEGRGGGYFFRMKPLQTQDVQHLLSRRFCGAEGRYNSRLGIFPVEHPQLEALVISRGIEAHPALRAAARNTAMAVDLVDAIMWNLYYRESEDGARHRTAEYWTAQLGANAAGLLGGALCQYVQSSALGPLDPAQRRRVAAWTLWAMNSMEAWLQPMSGRGEFRYPEFPGLSDVEREVAKAMIETHVVQYRNVHPVVRWEKYLATVVPANILVLFFLLGVPTCVLSGWASVDTGTVLYAVLQWVVQKVQVHHDAVLRPLQQSYCPDFDFEGKENATLLTIEEAIAQSGGEGAAAAYRSAVESHEDALEASIRHAPLVLVPRWTLQAGKGCLRLPRAPGGSILVSTAGGSGDVPDVVAPNLFVRAVRSAAGGGGGGGGGGDGDGDGDDPSPVVNLESELRSCGLLNECANDDDGDDRFLRGMVALWGGAFDDLPDEERRWPRNDRHDVLVNSQGWWEGYDGTERRLMELPDVGGNDTMVLALTTRSDSIRVALPTGEIVTVEEDMLTCDRQLLLTSCKLPPKDAESEQELLSSYRTFLLDRALPQVRVRFVFLRADLSPLAATSVRRHANEPQ